MRQVLTLPPWSSVPSQDRTSARGINRTANNAESAQKTKFGVANDKEWCRYIYGRVSVAPIIPTIAKHPSGDLLLLCVFAANPCRAIEKIIVIKRLHLCCFAH